MDIKEIIKLSGGAVAVANLFGITSQAVSQWSQVPINRVFELEKHLDSKITAAQMRPDIFKHEAA